MTTNDKPEIKAGQLWYVPNSYHYIIEISKIGIIRLWWNPKHGGCWECSGVLPMDHANMYSDSDATLCAEWPEGVPKPQIVELIDGLKVKIAALEEQLGVVEAHQATDEALDYFVPSKGNEIGPEHRGLVCEVVGISEEPRLYRICPAPTPDIVWCAPIFGDGDPVLFRPDGLFLTHDMDVKDYRVRITKVWLKNPPQPKPKVLQFNPAWMAATDEKVATLEGRMDALEDAIKTALAYRQTT
jgi:hypothetical protein